MSLSLDIKGLDKVIKKFNDIEKRLVNGTPAFKVIGGMGRKDVINHFEQTQGPKSKWKKLKKARKDGSAKPLNDTGRLKGSINAKESKDEAIVFTNVSYAGYHNNDRTGSSKLPQRKFMWLSKDTIKIMTKAYVRFMMNG